MSAHAPTPRAAIRDTKHRELGALAFASGEWHAFLGSAKGGRL